MAARRDSRLIVSSLGEYYTDLLTIDSWINNRSKASQANSLICAKLQEREQRIKERVEYLASKRGIEANELWKQILNGTAQKIDGEDLIDNSEDEES